MYFQIFFIWTYSVVPQGGAFGMIWMFKCKVKIFIPVCKLNVKVSGWMVLKKILSSRKNAFFIKLYGKFNFQVIIVKAIKNNSSLSFSWVQIKKSIIDTVKLHQWCRFQSGNNGCAQYLVFNITIKFKVVVLKQKFNHFDYFFILALPEVS